jgi:hypothetical protein
LPPRPPGASMSMSPSRSVRVGPRLRMPPRSPPGRRDFMVFMLARGTRDERVRDVGAERERGKGRKKEGMDVGLSGPSSGELRVARLKLTRFVCR